MYMQYRRCLLQSAQKQSTGLSMRNMLSYEMPVHLFVIYLPILIMLHSSTVINITVSRACKLVVNKCRDIRNRVYVIDEF